MLQLSLVLVLNLQAILQSLYESSPVKTKVRGCSEVLRYSSMYYLIANILAYANLLVCSVNQASSILLLIGVNAV